ncbi:hypothetical protein [Acetobacter sp. DsW_063]|uniref:DUF7448 domain-containing protein n=1 Tax=Acetobacter sp. DsW_063 TaxID=1514894 RepID=UPI0018EA20CD|nr:hypothetical protein [Acetobacter sp. DsW_063]
MADIKEILGKTIWSIDGLESGSEEFTFRFSDGCSIKFLHYQDCCEDVYVNDVCGYALDLVGFPLLVAREADGQQDPVDADSYTWTFYEFATNKGSVTVRWLGISNGYYSEAVDYNFSSASEVAA